MFDRNGQRNCPYCRANLEYDSIKTEELRVHIREGRVSDAVALLNESNNIDVNSEIRGVSMIFEACNKGYADLMGPLYRGGADIDQTNCMGATLLILAAYKGHLTIIEELARLNANVNGVSRTGQTAIFNAAHGGQAEAISLLIRLGADVN
eukprot:g1229.t1